LAIVDSPANNAPSLTPMMLVTPAMMMAPAAR